MTTITEVNATKQREHFDFMCNLILGIHAVLLASFLALMFLYPPALTLWIGAFCTTMMAAFMQIAIKLVGHYISKRVMHGIIATRTEMTVGFEKMKESILTEIHTATPDLEGIQIDVKALSDQLVPLLQESFSKTVLGFRGAEVKSAKAAAKMIAEGFEELAQDEFVQDLQAGDPEAINVYRAMTTIGEMLPVIAEKSPDGMLATYGPVLTQNAGKLYSLAKARRAGKGILIQSPQHSQSREVWGLKDR